MPVLPCFLLLLLGLCASSAAFSTQLSDRYEQASYEEALERVRRDPSRHVLVYFGMNRGCPPCNYTRNLLNGAELRELYRPHYVMVYIDLRVPERESDRAVIEKYRARWAPTLVILDSQGRMLARLARGFHHQRDGLLLHEFVTRRLYTKTNAQAYIAANFNAEGDARVVPDATAAVPPQLPDDRLTLEDLKKLPHERVSAEDLKTRLPGSVMHYTSRVPRGGTIEVWSGEFTVSADGRLSARSRRLDRPDSSLGNGTWRVNEAGQVCYELQWRTRRSDLCAWVYRVGDEFHLVRQDVPSARVYLTWTLAAP